MQRTLLFICLAAAFPLAAQDMKPNQEPVPSPSELRTLRGQDRPTGEAPEARTPSPSDLATERPRVDGDRPILENPRGEPIPAPGR